jgi:hypothetical protein
MAHPSTLHLYCPSLVPFHLPGLCSPSDGSYDTTITLLSVPMNFEELAGFLTHDFYEGERSVPAPLFFRRVDTCSYFRHFENLEGGSTAPTDEGQEGPQPINSPEEESGCYFFRMCSPDYELDTQYSNEIVLSIQDDGSLWWTYVGCYQPTFDARLGPGFITAQSRLYSNNVCPTGDIRTCRSQRCPSEDFAPEANTACGTDCARRCDFFPNTPVGERIASFVLPFVGIGIFIAGFIAYRSFRDHMLERDEPLLPEDEPVEGYVIQSAVATVVDDNPVIVLYDDDGRSAASAVAASVQSIEMASSNASLGREPPDQYEGLASV